MYRFACPIPETVSDSSGQVSTETVVIVRDNPRGIERPEPALSPRRMLEKLARDLPYCRVESGFLPDFAEVHRVFSYQAGEPRLVAARDLLYAAGWDAGLYLALRDEAAGILGLYGPGKLLRVGASRVVRGVGAQSDALHYVETHLAKTGRVLAVACLSLEHGLASPGRLFRKVVGFDDADTEPTEWRFAARVDCAVLANGQTVPVGEAGGWLCDADTEPDSDLLLALTSRVVEGLEPMVRNMGGVDTKAVGGGAQFAIRGGTAGAPAKKREFFMNLGAERSSLGVWLNSNAV